MSTPTSSTTTTTTKGLLTLETSDGKTFQVDEAAVTKLKSIKNMIDDGFIDDVIPLPHVDGKVMAKILEWCKKHSDDAATSEELKAWDSKFMKDMDVDSLLQLINAANNINVTELQGLVAQTFADMIKGKKVEEIRQIFKLENNFTPEEEEELRKQNSWVFE